MNQIAKPIFLLDRIKWSIQHPKQPQHPIKKTKQPQKKKAEPYVHTITVRFVAQFQIPLLSPIKPPLPSFSSPPPPPSPLTPHLPSPPPRRANLPRLPCPIPVLALVCVLLLHAAPRPALCSRAVPREGVSFAGAGNTIHQLLKDHGLPGGLLPRGVESYTLDESTGLLEARLSAPCYATYDNGDLAYFDNVVRGNLSKGALRGVEGLSQEELFVWLPVKGILVQDQEPGVILFDIGLAHKSLSRSLFEDPPDCKPSAAAGMSATAAARWKDRRGVTGLRLRREVAADTEEHQEQR